MLSSDLVSYCHIVSDLSSITTVQELGIAGTDKRFQRMVPGGGGGGLSSRLIPGAPYETVIYFIAIFIFVFQVEISVSS